jgi:hypothetical protein
MLVRWQQHLLLQVLAVAWSLQAPPAAAVPFRVYEKCPENEGGVGLCRKEPSSMQPGRHKGVVPAAATKPVPKQLPVDMRFPCTDKQSCKKVGH